MVSKSGSTRGGRGTSRRFVALLVGLSLIAAAGSLALALTNANAARSVAASATSLQWSNAASGAAAVARLALHQALVFEVDVQLGVATEAAADLAAAEARSALDEVSYWIERVPGATPAAADLAPVLAVGTEVLDLIETGDPARADTVIEDSFDPLYTAAIASLAEAQADHAGAIGAAQADAGRIERLTQLLVTLLIPAAAIVIHQLIMRRQYRDHRMQLEASLEAERELNRAKDAFIASLSHELRTPLTSIYGFAEYLIDQSLTDPDEAIELITMIKADSSELSRMVEDLLVTARLEAGTLSFEEGPVDLVALATEEAQRLERDGRSVQIHTQPARAWGTRKHIQHIVRNLISNAVRYGGGKVDIVVDQGPELATITVSDSGPGVPEDVRERMFERFVNEGEQTLVNGSIGLGLNVAQALAQSMDGTIHYERRLGWTNFIVALPPAPAEVVVLTSSSPTDDPSPQLDVAAASRESDEVLGLDWSSFFAAVSGERAGIDGNG